ncbi:TrkA family potassium uptake protein [uncultured Muribaculum sp.]|uniref:potassium channel family protein n=1 Tax=uncultured Muribaculum sp. TaxID=1918613 RepID=UPI0025E935C4|nr:TrkA family potassium uptake protein [uncultured Muribaculum sp.]
MRILIIGLGIYGSNLAIDLTAMGHEVIAADSSATLVEAIKDKISTAYIIDSTDEAALDALPLNSVELVIVAIGENFGASVKTVALLRKMGVKRIYARAVDDIHETILRGFQVDRILVPEQRAARELTRELALGAGVDAINIDRDHYVMKFPVPEFYEGMSLSEIDMEHNFGFRLVGVTRVTERRNAIGLIDREPVMVDNPTPDFRLQKGDMLVVTGTQRQFRDMLRHIK